MGQNTRRLDLLILEVRRATENTDPSTTSGITDEELVQYFNDAQDSLQSFISSQHPQVFLVESKISLVADQEKYDLPSDIFLGTRIEMIEWKFGSGSEDYRRIEPVALQQRNSSFTSDGPFVYIRRDQDILINPLPQSALTDGLRLTYQQRLRNLDIVRGFIKTATKTSNTLDKLEMDLASALNTKDADIITAADAILQQIAYISIVDLNGVKVLEAIPVKDYNKSTRVLTMEASFTTTLSTSTLENNYIVVGKSATSHTDLSDICERFLISYVTQKVLRRDSNILEADEQAQELRLIGADIAKSYQNPQEDLMQLPLDDQWLFGNEFFY